MDVKSLSVARRSFLLSGLLYGFLGMPSENETVPDSPVLTADDAVGLLDEDALVDLVRHAFGGMIFGSDPWYVANGYHSSLFCEFGIRAGHRLSVLEGKPIVLDDAVRFAGFSFAAEAARDARLEENLRRGCLEWVETISNEMETAPSPSRYNACRQEMFETIALENLNQLRLYESMPGHIVEGTVPWREIRQKRTENILKNTPQFLFRRDNPVFEETKTHSDIHELPRVPLSVLFAQPSPDGDKNMQDTEIKREDFVASVSLSGNADGILQDESHAIDPKLRRPCYTMLNADDTS